VGTEPQKEGTNMNLKQKIQEELEQVHEKMNKEQDNRLDRGQDGKFPYYFVDEVVTDFIKDISGLLDEATKQIQEKARDYQVISKGWGTYEKCVPLKDVLAILDGEKK
jgi:hypothetical protein